MTFVPVLRPSLLTESFGSESVAWNPGHGAPMYLDPVAALLLDVVDGHATVADLAGDVSDVVGIDEATATDQVLRVIGLYRSGDLLECDPALSAPNQPEFEFDPPDF